MVQKSNEGNNGFALTIFFFEMMNMAQGIFKKKKTENWKRETGNKNSKMEKPETRNRYLL